MNDARDYYLSDYARVAAALPGTHLPWLARQRAGALDLFAQRGFPGKRDEDWKYTSVAALLQQPFVATCGGAADDAPAAAAILSCLALPQDGSHLLVFHNGRYLPALSSLGKLPAGVKLDSVAHMLDADPDALQPYLDGDNAEPQGAFDALNSAFMADGAWLRLSRGTVLEAPLHLLFIATEEGAAHHMRNLIVAEDGAQATVIEHYVGADGAHYFNNVVTRIFAAPGAAVEHHKLQQDGAEAFHIAGIHARQQRDSRIASHAFTLGGALTRNDISTVFDAPGCEATLNGLYLVGGSQHVDTHTRIDHRQPNGTSSEHYRGVLDGRAHAVFNGKVIVHPGAQKTSAYQANHNLLLSRDAEVDTKPQLEIFADDVKCNHGATVGQLDETQLFYLRSRGIAEAAARSLLVHAFAHDVIERIRVASLRARLEQLLLARLPQQDLQQERIGGL